MQKELWQDGTGNYLKIAGTKQDCVSDQIFSYQDIEGFLPMEIRRINGQKEYIFDVSGKVSLAAYLAQTPFSRADMEKLFLSLFDMADRVEEYLIDSDGIAVHEEYIYMDKNTGEPAAVYCPDGKRGMVSAIAGLLEYIMEKMNQKDKELVFFIYGMHRLTREPGCTRKMLREYVSEAKTEPADVPEPARGNEKKERPKELRSGAARKTIEKGWLIPGLILAAGILIPVVLWRMGIFQKPLSGGTDWVKAAGAAAFFIVTAGYGAWRLMPAKRQGGLRENIVRYDEDKNVKKVCLIPRRGSGDIIFADPFPFRLKRAEGREEAQILQEGGEIFVLDEESDSGIFHNEKRLVPWKKARLQDGDVLRFADSEFVVEITQSEYVM